MYIAFLILIFVASYVLTAALVSNFDRTVMLINIACNLLVLVFSANLFIVYLTYELSAAAFIPLFLYAIKSARVYGACHLLYVVIGIGLVAFTLICSLDVILSRASHSSLLYRSGVMSLVLVIVALKVPSYPFHFGLPEAHVEISGIGSVILAAVILKYSLYLIIIFAAHSLHLSLTLYFYIQSIFTMAASILLILVVIDIKQLGAYLSIVHLNLSMLSSLSFCLDSYVGLEGLGTVHSANSLFYFGLSASSILYLARDYL